MNPKIENINLIRKIAWSFHKTTGLEWEDLMSEATVLYYNAISGYDPNKGQKLTTYLWMRVTSEMINYVKKLDRTNPTFSGLEIEKLAFHPVVHEDFIHSNLFESLTEEAQEIVDMILAFPELFNKESPKIAQMHISAMLEKRGWSKRKIEYAIQNIKHAL